MGKIYLRWLGVVLCLGDVVAQALAAMLRHKSHELEAWACSTAAARAFLITLCLFVLQPRAARNSISSAYGLLALVFIALAASVILLTTQKNDALQLALSLVFALGEFMLLCVLAPRREDLVTRAAHRDREAEDLETQLLPERKEEEVDPFKGQGATMRRLVSLAYPERNILFAATVALFVSSAAGLLTPLLFGKFIHSINSDSVQNMHELNETILQMILLFVVSAAFSMLRGALFTLAGERLVARFRQRLFDCILFQDISFFDANQSGELQSRLSSDTSAIQNAVTVNFSMSLRMLVQAVCSFAIILVLSWRLTLVMLSVVPLVGVIARAYGGMVKTLSSNYQDSLAKASETAEEAFSAIRTVRSFHKERFQVAKYATRVRTAYEFGKRRAWAYGTFLGVIGLLASLAVCLVLWMGGKMVIEQRDSDDDAAFSAATLTTFMMYTLNLAVALGGLSELYSTMISAVGASERMFAILDTEPAIDSRGGGGAIKSQATCTSVCFDSVHFTYPARKDIPVLKGVSFDLVPRSVNAFVGASGGGKSTIFALLQRFYDPDSGRILIDGQDLRDMDPVALRGRMSVVSQEPTLFSGSIYDNIAFGMSGGNEATEEQIHEAARRANAYDFIMAFKPDGFNTQVGERGVQLSGGQKQRIAIARAILKNPSLLLLDEATSALDSESEHLVQKALDEFMQDRTTVVIAHRLTTVVHASKIFVMSEGRVEESGTYNELVQRGGLFTTLVKRQLSNSGGDN